MHSAAGMSSTRRKLDVEQAITWSRCDYAAQGLKPTLDPATMRDGSADFGQRWSKVLRRATYDLHNGAILEDVDPKCLSLDPARGPILGTKPDQAKKLAPK